jgi:hypothetical protein
VWVVINLGRTLSGRIPEKRHAKGQVSLVGTVMRSYQMYSKRCMRSIQEYSEMKIIVRPFSFFEALVQWEKNRSIPFCIFPCF